MLKKCKHCGVELPNTESLPEHFDCYCQECVAYASNPPRITEENQEQSLAPVYGENKKPRAGSQIVEYVLIPGTDVGYEYTVKYEPRCILCNHPIRKEAEQQYLTREFTAMAVKRWLDTQGIDIKYDAINTHMRKHCNFGNPVIDLSERMAQREQDLSAIDSNPFEWLSHVLSNLILDLGTIDVTADPERYVSVANMLVRATTEKAKIDKMKYELWGAEEQARAIIADYNRKLAQFMEDLVTHAGPEERAKISMFLNEYQKNNDSFFGS